MKSIIKGLMYYVDLVDYEEKKCKINNNEMVKINLKNIEYIEALDDYIKIYIKPYPVLTLMTLKGVMEKLPAQLFARVHRSYIVPLNRIEKFSRNKIQIAGKEIPIGSSYADVYEKLLEINKH